MSLRINVAAGSQALADSPIQHAIVSLASAVAGEARLGRVPDYPALEVTFLLPGKLDKPSFSGMRMGGYNPQDCTLYFERAVPETMIHSGFGAAFVSAVVDDMVTNADEFFRETDIDFDRLGWTRLAADISRRLNGI